MTQLQSIRSWAKSQALSQSVRKGNAFEDRVEAILTGLQMVVDRTRLNRSIIRTKFGSRWITKKGDFFGCIDFIAFSPAEDFVLFIQATTSATHVREKMREIEKTFRDVSEHRIVEVWLEDENRQIIIHRWDRNGIWIPLDFRTWPMSLRSWVLTEPRK